MWFDVREAPAARVSFVGEQAASRVETRLLQLSCQSEVIVGGIALQGFDVIGFGPDSNQEMQMLSCEQLHWVSRLC